MIAHEDALPAVQGDSYIPLRTQVHKILHAAILRGHLKPGERLVEEKLCGQLKVSRSPLREALRRLEAEGLVAILARQGAVVTELTRRDLTDLFAVREVLEGLASRLAAESITLEELSELGEICRAMGERIRANDMPAVAELNAAFHERVISASRNKWIKRLMTRLRDQIQRVYISSVQHPDRAPKSLMEHLEIQTALRNRDAAAAEKLTREHVQRAKEVAVSSGDRIQLLERLSGGRTGSGKNT